MNHAPLGRHRAAGQEATEERAGGPFDKTSLLLALAVQAIGERLDTDEILGQTLEFACAVTGAAHAMMSLVDGAGEVVRVESRGEVPAPGQHGVAVPVIGHGRTFGTLHLSGRVEPFVGTDVALVGVLARAAASALGHLRARSAVVAEAITADRSRISRDLHDLVGQRLYAAGLQLQALHPSLDAVAQQRIDAALAGLDLAVRDVRATVNELRLPPGSLADVVRELAAEYAGVLGFLPQVRVSGPASGVPDEAAGHLLLALREALSNVARHADATHAWVDLDVSREWALLRVSDDGAGLADATPGHGLRNLRSRAAELGGVFRVAGREPAGTRLEWIVPLTR